MTEENTMTEEEIEKKTRAKSKRGFETRFSMSLDEKRAMMRDQGDPLRIPDSVKRDGFDYKFERRSLKGEIDMAFENAVRSGWTPVPASRDPFPHLNPSTADPQKAQYFCRHDTVLMEREKILGEEERERNIQLSTAKVLDSDAYGFNPENTSKNRVKGV